MSSNKELIKKKDEVKFEKIEAKDDKELYLRIINILTEQIKVSFYKFTIVFRYKLFINIETFNRIFFWYDIIFFDNIMIFKNGA